MRLVVLFRNSFIFANYLSQNWTMSQRNISIFSSIQNIFSIIWNRWNWANAIYSMIHVSSRSSKREMNFSSLRSVQWSCPFRCPNLIDFTCTWAYGVTTLGFNQIVKRCDQLTSLSLIGCYQISGEILFDVPEKYLRQIRSINFEQCNQIDDQILLDLYRRKRSLTLINYYGSTVEDEDEDEDEEETWMIFIDLFSEMYQIKYFQKKKNWTKHCRENVISSIAKDYLHQSNEDFLDELQRWAMHDRSSNDNRVMRIPMDQRLPLVASKSRKNSNDNRDRETTSLNARSMIENRRFWFSITENRK